MCGALHSADDPQMGAAATQIVGEGLLDVVDGGMRFLPQEAPLTA